MIKGATALLIGATVAAASAQAPDTRLEAVLRQAEARRLEYREAFKDLTAVETRVTELFDSHAEVEKRRTIVSDFLVYQSQLKEGDASEYRIAREVDGKTVDNPTEDAIRRSNASARRTRSTCSDSSRGVRR